MGKNGTKIFAWFLRTVSVMAAMFVWGMEFGRILQHEPFPFLSWGLSGTQGFILWFLFGWVFSLFVCAFIPHLIAAKLDPKVPEMRSSASPFAQ